MAIRVFLKHQPLLWLIVTIIFLEVSLTNAQWNNQYHKPLNFFCPGAQNIYRLRSVYSNFRKDRRFDPRCRSTPGLTNKFCRPWTPYTSADGVIDYNCPGDYYLNGIRSQWSQFYKDRRWGFRCCKRAFENYVAESCFYTSYKNNYKQFFDYSINQLDYVIKGIWTSGLHDVHKDRRWRFRVCRLKKRFGILRGVSQSGISASDSSQINPLIPSIVGQLPTTMPPVRPTRPRPSRRKNPRRQRPERQQNRRPRRPRV